LPLHEDNTPSQMSELAKKFGEKLKSRTKLPIYYINEYLSSRTIKDEIINESRNQKKIKNRPQKHKKNDLKSRIDALSACLILETWLKTD